VKKYLFIAVSIILLQSTTCDKNTYLNYNAIEYYYSTENINDGSGSILLKVKIKIPENYFAKKAILTLNPFIVFTSSKKKLQPMIIYGESFKNKEITVNYSKGAYLEFDFIVDNTEEICNLLIKGTLETNHILNLPDRIVTLK
jgi:hypothetical protein